jgi:hypothetical protein
MHDKSPLLVLATVSLLLGCAESQRPEATGEANVRGLHAIVDGPETVFRIEERSLGAVNYKGVTTVDAFDDLSYQFNFDSALPGDTQQTRIASRSLTVVPDMEYLFVLTGSFADAEVLLWESEERQWEGTEEVTQIAAGHLSTTLDTVDFYLVAPEAAPASGEARGTLEFGDRLDDFDVEAGDYRIVLTPAGDPATILFRSTTLTLNERLSTLFTIHDTDASITSGVSVRRITATGGSTEVTEINSPSTQRFLHAASGTGNFDVYVDEDFDSPIVQDLAYGMATGDVAVPRGESAYTFTAAGNVGAVLFEEDRTIAGNTRTTSFLVGPPDDLDVLSLIDDRRPVVGTSKVRMVQLAENFDTVDIYLRPAGTDIDDVNPSFPNTGSPLSSGYSRLEPGDYEITVTDSGEKTPLAPVLSLDLAAGDIAEVAIIDNVDPNLLDLIRYD